MVVSIVSSSPGAARRGSTKGRRSVGQQVSCSHRVGASRADGYCPPTPREGLEELGLDVTGVPKRKGIRKRLVAGLKNVVGSVASYALVRRPGKKSIVLEPPERVGGEVGPDALLVVFCGGRVSPSHYVELSRSVQKHTGTRLWVVIPKFARDLSFEKSARVMFDVSLAMAKEAGFDAEGKSVPAESVYVVGHSWGGYAARGIALEKSAGLVLLNSWLGRFRERVPALMMERTRYSVDVSEYAKPFLVLSGDRDGQMRPSHIAEAFHMSEKYKELTGCGDVFAAKTKGVVCLQGLNHSVHINDDPNYGRGDTSAGVGREDAVDLVASTIAAWIDSNRMSSASAAETLLVRRVKETGDLLSPLIASGTGRSEDGQIRELAALAQERAANVSGLDQGEISTAVVEDFKNFVYSKPLVFQNTETGKATVMVSALVVWDESGMGGVNNSRNRGSAEVWVKMKSQEYCCESGLMGAAKGAARSAKEINEETFAKALEMVSPWQRERYEREGRKLVFAPDRELPAGPPWLAAPMVYSPESGEDGSALVLTCPSGKSPTVGLPDRFAGMHYIKIPSLASFVEYILVDAFIRTEALLYVRQ
ncbi:hypothetical protein HOP50_08g51100 [Chloropicon primus]|nr:hypothetical protein HOP50_08g51100 [Chloropicon primus]